MWFLPMEQFCVKFGIHFEWYENSPMILFSAVLSGGIGNSCKGCNLSGSGLMVPSLIKYPKAFKDLVENTHFSSLYVQEFIQILIMFSLSFTTKTLSRYANVEDRFALVIMASIILWKVAVPFVTSKGIRLN